MNSRSSTGKKAAALFRHRHLLAAFALVGVLVAVMVTFLLPRHYESTGRLRVVENGKLYSIYGMQLGGAGSGRGVAAQAASEEVCSRAVYELGLDREIMELPESEQSEKRDALIRDLARNTTVAVDETVPSSSMLTITHRSASAEDAWLFVLQLAAVLQDTNRGPSHEVAEKTFQSIRERRAELEKAHEEAAAELEAFVQTNVHHRLGAEKDTRSRLREETAALGKVDREVAALESQLKNVREQMADEPQWMEPEEGAEDAPRVKNPMYAELKKSELEVLSALTVRRELRADYAARVKTLQEEMAEFPALEEQWNVLMGRESKEREALQALRGEEAAAREELAKKVARETLVMEIVEPPAYSDRPIKPYGGFLWVAGLLGGLAAGLGTVLVKTCLDRSFHTPREVADAMDVPVLGAIPLIETLAEREAVKRRNRLAAAVVLGLLVLAGAGVFLHMNYDAEVSSLIGNTLRFGK